MFSHLPGDSEIHRGVSSMPIDVYKTNGYELRGGRIEWKLKMEYMK
jgi:hypothetical protein